MGGAETRLKEARSLLRVFGCCHFAVKPAKNTEGHLFKVALTCVLIGGAKGDRTLDLMTASHALSQLSYGPNRIRRFNVLLILATADRLSQPCAHHRTPFTDRMLHRYLVFSIST